MSGVKFTYKSFLFLLIFFYSGFVSAQFTFQRTFQAPGMNGGLALSITSDSGYVVTGQHGSSGEGNCDFYVYKRNACGGTDFFYTYGDQYSQGGKSIQQTKDGGFIVTGITQPPVAPTSTVIIQETVLMKLDPSGNLSWVKNFGNGISDWSMYVQQTTDGGYVVTGSTVNPAPYTWDVFLLKTDANGVTQWSKVFVAPGEEFSNYVEQTKDGGYFITGYSWGTVHAGDDDVLAIKLDATGSVQWSNVYGGTKRDGNTRCDGLSLFGTRGRQTKDGGYAIASSTRSFGVNDSADVWLLKLNSSGNVQWNKTYGGISNEESRGLYITHDDGYAIIAWTTSFGFGDQDEYLLKTDSNGSLQWSKTYGGTAREKGESIMESPIDHGYYIDGYSMSFTPNPATDVFDAYAIKTDSLGVSGCNETSPPTIVGTGAPVISAFPFTLATLPTRPTPVFIQHAYNAGEYPLCEKLPPPPQAIFSAPPICVGEATTFTDASVPGYGVIVDWIWDFGDGNTADSISNPIHTYTTAGTYSVTLIIHTTCTADTVVNPVVVNPLPVPLFKAPPVCFNNPSIFTDQSTGNNTVSQWNWNFGDSSSASADTSSLQNPTHIYGTAGTFSISLIVTNNFGCKDTVLLTTTINPLPLAAFSSTTVCLGDTTCFSDQSTVAPGAITTWSWNFGDPASGAANTSAIQGPCHVFSASGSFNVMLTVTSDSGCQANKALPAIVIAPPVAAINPKNVCLNAVTNFTDGSVPTTGDPLNAWDWNFGDGTPHATQQNPSHTYAAAGTYTVTLIITSQNGCKDTTNIPVTVYLPPVASFAKPDSGCAPICVNYNDLSTSVDGTINQWQWTFPGGTPQASNASSPQNICYNTPGTYGVSLTVTSSLGCKDTLSLPMMQVYPWPTAEFCVTPLSAPSTEPLFNFCDMWSSDVVQWIWDFGDNETDSSSTDPVHSYSASATQNDFYNYTICIKVKNQYGCWDTICHPVDLIPEFTFYIPNTFTPNSDHNNEFFFGKCRGVKDFNIWIFDRWGNQLWDCHHSGKNTDWDGPGQDGLSSFCKWDGVIVQGGQDMNGASNIRAQEDVYVWKVQLTDIFKKEHTYIGHVNIVR
jgi:PKD repeat protein